MVSLRRPFAPARLGAAFAVAAAIVASLVAFPAFALVHEQIYPAPRAPLSLTGLPPAAGIDTVQTADGLTLHGIEIPPREGKATLLVLHGNGFSAMDVVRWFTPVLEDGYGLVAAEYREYSGNPGRAGEAGLANDADAFYARARALAGGGRVIVIGHSLGGGVAFGLSTRHTLDALVTIGTFTSLTEMVPLLVRPLVEDRYDNLAALAKLDEPYFLVHGTADSVIPFSHGDTLGKEAIRLKKPGAAFMIQDADHAPDGRQIAAIIRAVDARLSAGGAETKVTLPQPVKLTPFIR